MSGLFQLLLATHVIANLVWIGSILGVAALLTTKAGEVRVAAPFAYELYRRVAVPAFGVSVLAGLIKLLLSAEYYFVTTKFMHPKLLFAAIVIALHHVIGARAKAVSSGRREAPGPVGILALMLLISAAAATVFVIVKPFSHGAAAPEPTDATTAVSAVAGKAPVQYASLPSVIVALGDC